ncbi:hypothetical protein [Antrihabitans spumae]|uniref:DUF4333 domain-containing protein n=1 Tax=Antrihabitans spumae TaxID=3373370 RepID=A0ABW7KGG9_9NOCA
MKFCVAVAAGFVASAAILVGCGENVDGTATAGDETSATAEPTTEASTRTSSPRTSTPRSSSSAPVPFTIGALETKLASNVDALSVACTGPAAPESGDQFDCVAVIAEGDLPITVTLTDAAGQKYAYDGKADFGTTIKSVSGSFSLK